MKETPQFSPSLSVSDADLPNELNFSPTLTALCLMICLCGFALIQWSVSSSEVMSESVTASRDLERLASRMLGFESRFSELSTVEQSIFRLWRKDGDTQEQLREWYAELPHERRNPLDELYAGILNGEAELRTDLLESIEVWKSGISPAPKLSQILDWVYLNGSNVDSGYDMFQAQLAEEVPANWFYFQLAGRLASQSGNQVLQESLQQQFQLLTDRNLWRWRAFIIFEFALAWVGLMCLVYLLIMWFKQREVQNVGTFNQRISPWLFHEGFAVLVRGGALSIVLIALVSVVPDGENILENYGSLFLYLPTVGLAIMLLGRPPSQSLLQVFGCKDLFQRFKSSFPILLGVIALGLMGDWFIMFGGEVFEASVHWTEWFLPQVVWGSQAELLKMAIEVVVLAPIFEEIIFRGLVFLTLRTKFSFPISMIGSAAVFALAHGYGPIAFLTVFWSGLLWAWIYERTGSVFPGICAHAINNGLVLFFLVAIFR